MKRSRPGPEPAGPPSPGRLVLGDVGGHPVIVVLTITEDDAAQERTADTRRTLPPPLTGMSPFPTANPEFVGTARVRISNSDRTSTGPGATR